MPSSNYQPERNISIHAPRGGSDSGVWDYRADYPDFNPRSPWGERPSSTVLYYTICYFNPRSPWGERQAFTAALTPLNLISIHAPRGGSDQYVQGGLTDGETFQSTLPVGGATPFKSTTVELRHISIHAPRGGSDTLILVDFSGLINFNPRSPWGERLLPGDTFDVTTSFQSTLPVGGATTPNTSSLYCGVFQSTLPVGGATHSFLSYIFIFSISIHAPRGGSDATVF